MSNRERAAMRPFEEMPWWIAYAVGVVLAVGFAWGRKDGLPPVLLALALPGAVALSRMRLQPLYASWIVAVVPTAVGFWALGEGKGNPGIAFVLGVAGLLTFVVTAKGSRTAPWLALLGGAVVLVAYFSGGQGSAGTMLRWLVAHGASDADAHRVTLAFRKTVHFTFYGLTGLTSLRALRAAGSELPDSARAALLAALALASFDELRQSAYANRTGSAWDVLLDLAGASTFVGLSVWRDARKR